MASIKKGSVVSWEQGPENISGRVRQVYASKVQQELLGMHAKRGTEDDPALLIRAEDGSHVLKHESEVRLGF